MHRDHLPQARQVQGLRRAHLRTPLDAQEAGLGVQQEAAQGGTIIGLEISSHDRSSDIFYYLFRNVIEATKLLIEEEEGIMFYVRLFLRQDRWRACVVMMAGPEVCLLHI